MILIPHGFWRLEDLALYDISRLLAVRLHDTQLVAV